MDSLIYIVPIAIVVVVAIFIVLKFVGGGKAAVKVAENVAFCVTEIVGRADDGTIEVDGIVKNTPICVGDLLNVADKYGNVYERRVRVIKIDPSVSSTKSVESVEPEEFTTLFLYAEWNDVPSEIYLER